MEPHGGEKGLFLLILLFWGFFNPVIYRSVFSAVKILCSLLVVSGFYHVKVNSALLVMVIGK